MKDYQRPVLTLKCCGSGATVLSSVMACQAPKSHPLICHKEEANVSTTGEEQGLSSSRKSWEVPAWAFQWGGHCRQQKCPFVGLQMCMVFVRDSLFPSQTQL